jgi:ASC-1-like (ASCH) protein
MAEENEYLEFGCTFRGYKIKTRSSVRDKETKQTALGDCINFANGMCKLHKVKDIEKIKTLVNRNDFENDKPGAVKFWPSNVGKYNEFAKANNLPLVNRKGGVTVGSLNTKDPETIKALAEQEMEIKRLKDELEALQNSVTTSNKKGK